MVFWNWWTKLFLIYTTWHRTNFPPGWKIWPDSSFERDRSIFSISLHGTFRAIFVWPSYVSVSVRYLFYQPMDEKIKTWPLRFPAKENPNMEKALFDWPIVLQYDVKAKYRLISRKFSGVKFFHPRIRLANQKPRALNWNRSINQSNRSISVCLLFLFCSRVFISRSYENRSQQN